jgi:hypothetical protein
VSDDNAQQNDDATHDDTPQNETKRTGGTLDELLASLDDDSRSAISNVVKNLRNENASYRTKVRDLEPLATKAKELEEAGRSDVEKLTDRVSQAEKLAGEKDLHIARLTAVLEHGLDMDSVELLGGGTAEEIATKAQRLAELINTGRGLRGKPKEQLRGGASKDEDEISDERESPSQLAARIQSRRQYG